MSNERSLAVFEVYPLDPVGYPVHSSSLCVANLFIMTHCAQHFAQSLKELHLDKIAPMFILGKKIRALPSKRHDGHADLSSLTVVVSLDDCIK